MSDSRGDAVCAVVVTYRPRGDVTARIEGAAAQVSHVVVVDNGSDAETVATLRSISTERSVHLIANAENRGVATALNQGVDWARAQGFRWVLLLDHDTVVRPGITTVLLEARAAHPRSNRVAVVGSNYVETANGRRLIEEQAFGFPWVDRLVAITSGSLLSVSAFEDVGRFRDELFVDDVDTEFCLRARAKGYEVIVATRLTMEHTIGEAHHERSFLWRTVRPLNYSPVRWYYLIRNSIVIAREYRHVAPGWALTHVLAHAKWAMKAVLFEESRGAKAREIIRGAWHGIQGRLGPRSSAG
jgi:rhamnosyltransferase